jgi:hypothetical protein
VTLFSFWGFGSIGLWPYILPYFSLRNGAEWSEETLFILASISVAAALYFLGHFKVSALLFLCSSYFRIPMQLCVAPGALYRRSTGSCAA